MTHSHANLESTKGSKDNPVVTHGILPGSRNSPKRWQPILWILILAFGVLRGVGPALSILFRVVGFALGIFVWRRGGLLVLRILILALGVLLIIFTFSIFFLVVMLWVSNGVGVTNAVRFPLGIFFARRVLLSIKRWLRLRLDTHGIRFG